jgi:hypothetical protein
MNVGLIARPQSRETSPLLLATLDGADPRNDWTPWQTPFDAILADCEATDPLVPAEHADDRIFKFRVDADEQARLFAAGREWSAYVGAFVDPSKDEVIDKHRKFLSLIASAGTPQFKRVGYYLFALTEGLPSKTEADTAAALLGQSRDRLKTDANFLWVSLRAALPMVLQSAGLMAINRYIRSQ